MTHRGRQYKNNRVLRYLDLSFQGSQHQNNGNVPNNGLRPPSQGGAKASARRAAPRPGPRQSPVDYGAQLEADIQRLLQAEGTDDPATSGWTSDLTRQSAPSTEPTPLSHRSMAASKLEQQSSSYQYNKVAMSAKPKARDNSAYYRPNASHRYLMATDKRPRTAGYQGEHRLGRPTRTTLLRARQRCNSAPITSYETHQEKHRRAEQQAEMKKQRTSQTNQSISDLLGANVPAGESLHSFLIGARYNSISWIRDLSFDDTPRAHHLDEKSLKEYGVYLPRQSSGSPQNCFIIKKMRLKQRESEDLEDEESKPEARPERPVTASTRGRTRTPPTPHSPVSPAPMQHPTNQPVLSKRASPLRPSEAQPTLVITPQNGRSPTMPSHRQAWSEKANIEINSAPQDQPNLSPESPAAPISVEVTTTNDGINIKGVGFIGSPPKIARPMVSHQRTVGNRPSSSGSPSSVMVQGRSIYNYNISPTPTGASRPMPRPKTAVGPQRELTVRDVSQRLEEETRQQGEEQQNNAPVVIDNAHVVNEPEPVKAPSIISLSGEGIEENVEVMSTGSEDDAGSRLHGPSPSPAGSPRPSHPTPIEQDSPQAPEPKSEPEPELESEQDLEEAELKVEASSEDDASVKESPSDPSLERLTPIIVNPNRASSARSKRGHVRFADQIDPSDINQDASNKDSFFMTDKEEKTENTEEGSGDKDIAAGDPVLPTVTIESTNISEPTLVGDSPSLDDAPQSFYNGSGDCPPEEMEDEAKSVSGPTQDYLSPQGVDNDDGSVMSEDHPVKVISVDITQKVAADKT